MRILSKTLDNTKYKLDSPVPLLMVSSGPRPPTTLPVALPPAPTNLNPVLSSPNFLLYLGSCRKVELLSSSLGFERYLYKLSYIKFLLRTVISHLKWYASMDW